uniref:Alpha-1,3/1,6-mannosyltransferase ALG2 n=1 Tax=Syphacia muris TaxID=451379 RepID=A0A0N5APG5_9BILA
MMQIREIVMHNRTADMLIVIIHPELWNGGSDRCNVGMIRHFLNTEHRIVWYTSWSDKYWSKDEFSNVELRELKLPLHPGDWLSENVAIGWQLLFSDLNPDLIILDHSASCVPLLKWRFPKVKILFYCHFPQQLVTPSRFFLYRWYANLIGVYESFLFKDVDTIMVNSKFTKKKFSLVMPEISKDKIMVVYPPCDVDVTEIGEKAISRMSRPKNERYTFLSLNRFWPEKRLEIVIEAAVELKKKNLNPRILLAGSVMPTIPESKIYYTYLKEKVKEFQVSDLVEFVPSPTEYKKFALLRECDTVLYTPENEHFGIVPIEALEQRRPVIVCNSGGPAETVLDGITGSKISYPDGQLLAEEMEKHMNKPFWPALDDDTGFEVQRKRFDNNFSLKGFGNHLNDAIAELFSQPRSAMRDRA